MMKTRFCPSPTGFMHLGNARTALFSALLALKEQGNFLLRIEDTDQVRSEEGLASALIMDLHWLGLKWQEGPYWQSQRQDIYHKYYQALIERKLAYPCFCTPEQLMLSRKLQRAQGKAPRYAGTCRHLTAEEIATKRARKIPETLRFHVEAKQIIQFPDLIKGRQRFQSNEIGDFIIHRADGTPAFLFCNAIDDSLMGITHVLRGDDHLTNTPRQILILKALDLPVPSYGHIPLIFGYDNSPLSKRHGSRSIQELRELGYLPLAVVNYMARLGHYYENSQFMTLSELSAQFSLDTIGKSPAKFDAAYLEHWQKEGVIALNNGEFWEWIEPCVQTQVPSTDQQLFIDAVKNNVLFPQDAKRWANIFYQNDLNYSEETKHILRETGHDFFAIAYSIVHQHPVPYQDLCHQLQTRLNVKAKALFMPLRCVLTGETHGPELAKIYDLLGRERVILRFKQILELFF